MDEDGNEIDEERKLTEGKVESVRILYDEHGNILKKNSIETITRAKRRVNMLAMKIQLTLPIHYERGNKYIAL